LTYGLWILNLKLDQYLDS